MSDWLADYYATKVDERDDEILRLRAENEKLRAENETHKEIAVRETMNVATLRAALKRIAEQDAVEMVLDPQWATRAAAAALKETGDE